MNTIVREKRKKRSKFNRAYWACRNWFRDNVFEPIWFRFFGHKFHIVRTKLPPSSWYDTDIRVLYAVMALIEWFVENDMRAMSEEDYLKEKKVYEGSAEEQDKWALELIIRQYEDSQKILKIYNWWKKYDERWEEIDKAHDNWYNFKDMFRVDDELFSYKMNETEKEEEKRLFEIVNDLEDKLVNEEQEMLKLAIEVRKSLWS